MIRKLTLLGLSIIAAHSFAQVDRQIVDLIKDVNPAKLAAKGERLVNASHYRTVEINTRDMLKQLKGVAHRNSLASGLETIIELPLPDGSMHQYRVFENDTLNPKLAAHFPQIRTYDGVGITDAREFVKFDLTPKGFHAMIMYPGKSPIFIDPYLKGNTSYYMVYDKKDFKTNKTMKCGVTSTTMQLSYLNRHPGFATYASCQLRQYRLALAATYQYTSFVSAPFPPDKLLALSAQTTTMNRVNGVYEGEIGVTMQFIPDNTDIIYDSLPQPYTSGNTGLLIDENQINIDQVIGSANYDIGHVFDQNTSTSGLASLGGVCDAQYKASAVTGSQRPVGDPFDIDYVAHEIGHQFNANHTQNNACNRNHPTAVEPGSGSTIMAYAGICDPNVQAHSDAYFNGINLEEMGPFIDSSSTGGSCGMVISNTPAAPVISPLQDITIPASTPFSLVAQATGVGSENFTYTFEQQNNEITPQPPVSTAMGGPNFRSSLGTLSPIQYFPNLISLANNGPFTWEVLPSVTRTMNFRLTVRGNHFGGSCNAYEDMQVSTDANAGPFVVTYPTGPNLGFVRGSSQNITWSVANTQQYAAFVNILLSNDGGQSYPLTLAQNVSNTGSFTLTLPQVITEQARIMVQSANQTFFAISQNNFAIFPTPNVTQVARNPLNKNNAFVYYDIIDSSPAPKQFTLNGLNASVYLDAANKRFVIKAINTAKKVENVTITVTRAGGATATSNPFTIPGIL